MAVEITRAGKTTLIAQTPVMPAAGSLGFGDEYRSLIDYANLGALVTNPVSLQPRRAASGARVVPLEAGVLMHTGLPNPGLRAIIRDNRRVWDKLPIPVVVHLIGETPDRIRRAVATLDAADEVDAIELGLDDDTGLNEAIALTRAAARSEKPLLARLPFHDCAELAQPIADSGADALVISAPPRGTARDPHSGRLVSGRVYGPLVKPLVLRMVGRLRREVPADIPIIACGGIHSPADARDFIEAGAVAVQVDAATWTQPRMLERIARDLGGWIATRQADAMLDEWHPDMGQTEALKRRGQG